MITTFDNLKISGVLSVLPENEYDYDEETLSFADASTRRLKKIMGFGKRRAAKETTTVSDFCLYGLNYLIDKNLLNKSEIGAILVLSVTPDYYMPQMSNIIQGELGLGNDVVCMDISQACAAYIVGLFQAGLLLPHLPSNKKIIMCTGDVLCRKRKEAKLVEPSFGGDAATITVIEKSDSVGPAYFSVHNDGSQRDALIIHAGGFKMPRTSETAIPRDTGYGNVRSYNDLWMDGSAVFNFVQKEVPIMLDELLAYSGVSKDSIDFYLFHQPNKFMLQKLAQRINVDPDKMPMNIVETFGNSSGSCVGVNMTYNLGKRLEENKYNCCLAAFGGGLGWSSAIMNIGEMDFCEMIISNL